MASSSSFLTVIKGLWPVLRAVAGLIVLVLIVAWLSGFFVTKISGEPEPLGRRTFRDEPTAVVEAIEETHVQEAVGELKAEGRSVISSRVLAAIKQIRVTAGDQVREGDVLLELDEEELQARVRQAEQVLAAAQATLQQAQANFERVSQLRQRSAASQEDFDLARQQLLVAQAEEVRATQTLSESQIQASYATIRAPRDGRVVNRLAEPGDTAQPGQPLLVLYETETLRLEAPVLEDLAVHLRPGQAVQVKIDALGEQLDAVIDEIVPQAEANSRSFLVKAGLSEPVGLYEGMFGRLLIVTGERTHIYVPSGAIVRLGQLDYVDVVVDDQFIERRLVRVGSRSQAGKTEILAGVEPGEVVVRQDVSTGTPRP